MINEGGRGISSKHPEWRGGIPHEVRPLGALVYVALGHAKTTSPGPPDACEVNPNHIIIGPEGNIMSTQQTIHKTIRIENIKDLDSITVHLDLDVSCSGPSAGSYITTAPIKKSENPR